MHKPEIRNHIRFRRLTALLAAGATSVVLVGCGGGSDAGSSANSASESLTVEVSSTATDILNYIAEGKGYFKKENVKVKIDGNAGPNAITQVVSGKADVAGYGGSTPLVVAGQGKPTSIIYGISGGGVGGVMIANPEKVKSVADLQKLDKCKLGAFPEGSSSYGYAEIYVKNLGLKCDVIPFQGNAPLVGAVAAGRIDAAVVGYANAATTIEQRNLPILIDTRDPAQRQKYSGDDIVEVTFWATKAGVEKNREAIVRWIRAIDRAREFLLDKANINEVTDILAANKDFTGFAKKNIQSDIVEPFISYVEAGNEKGFITKKTWQESIDRYELFGIKGFKASDPENAYDTAMDFGPYQDAQK